MKKLNIIIRRADADINLAGLQIEAGFYYGLDEHKNYFVSDGRCGTDGRVLIYRKYKGIWRKRYEHNLLSEQIARRSYADANYGARAAYKNNPNYMAGYKGMGYVATPHSGGSFVKVVYNAIDTKR